MAFTTIWNNVVNDLFNDHSCSLIKDLVTPATGCFWESGYSMAIQKGSNGNWWGGVGEPENAPLAGYEPLLLANSERYTAKMVGFSATAVTATAGMVLYLDRDNAYIIEIDGFYTLIIYKIIANVPTVISLSATFNNPNTNPLIFRITYEVATPIFTFQYSKDNEATWITELTVNPAEFTPIGCGLYVKNWLDSGVYPSVRAIWDYWKVENNSSGIWETTYLDTFQDGIKSTFVEYFPTGSSLEPGKKLAFYVDSGSWAEWTQGAAWSKTCPIAYYDLTYSSGIYKGIGTLEYVSASHTGSDCSIGMTVYKDRDSFYTLDYRLNNDHSYRTIDVYRVVANGVPAELAVVSASTPPSSSDPIYLITKYNYDNNSLGFYYSRNNFNTCETIYSTNSASFVPTRIGFMAKTFYSLPQLYGYFGYFQLQHWEGVSVPDEIGPDFTLNKYKILPYEHGSGTSECETNARITPFFLGHSGLNLRTRLSPESSSLG